MSWAGKQDLLCICFPKWSKVTRTVELDSYNLTVIWDQASYRNIGGRNLLLLHVMLNISCIWSSRIDVHIPPLCVLFVVHVCVFTLVYILMYIYCAYCERAWKLFMEFVFQTCCRCWVFVTFMYPITFSSLYTFFLLLLMENMSTEGGEMNYSGWIKGCLRT